MEVDNSSPFVQYSTSNDQYESNLYSNILYGAIFILMLYVVWGSYNASYTNSDNEYDDEEQQGSKSQNNYIESYVQKLREQQQRNLSSR